MIGGHDITFKTHSGAIALDSAVRVVRRLWKDAVFQDAFSDQITADPFTFALARVSEVFAFRSRRDAEYWNEHGYDKSVRNTMIHIVSSLHSATLVIDDGSDPDAKRTLAALKRYLRQDIFVMTTRAPEEKHG